MQAIRLTLLLNGVDVGCRDLLEDPEVLNRLEARRQEVERQREYLSRLAVRDAEWNEIVIPLSAAC